MAKVRVTSTHHVAVRFDCPIEVIWDEIVRGMGGGRRFEAQGYRIAPLIDDPRAYLGGYRMWREGADDPDERLMFISEHDNVARRLSLIAYYMGATARSTVVNATYSAEATAEGNWYRIDCHGTYDLQTSDGVSAAGVAELMAKSQREMDHYLRSSLEAQRPVLESPGPPERLH